MTIGLRSRAAYGFVICSPGHELLVVAGKAGCSCPRSCRAVTLLVPNPDLGSAQPIAKPPGDPDAPPVSWAIGSEEGGPCSPGMPDD